ncbi:ead/Ea22-like family protein [Klebsiella michiganensis]
MTTDITELAQSLKASAEKATPGNWRAFKYHDGRCGIGGGHHDEIMVCEHISKRRPHDAEFIAMANPANVLALVEALEKAQATEAHYNRGWNEAHEQEERAEAAQKRIAELDSELEREREKSRRVMSRIAELESRTVTVAAADVLAERQRQISAEGWTPSHDDTHKNNEMAFAAACYAFHSAAASWDLEDCGTEYDSHPAPKNWPWEPEWWKPKSARADLVRAGALILAELERIDRAAGIRVEAE